MQNKFVTLKQFLQILNNHIFSYSEITIPETTSNDEYLTITQAGHILKELVHGKGDNVIEVSPNDSPIELRHAITLIGKIKPWIDPKYASKFTVQATGEAAIFPSTTDLTDCLISINDSEFRTPTEKEVNPGYGSISLSLNAGDTVKIAGQFKSLALSNLTLDGIFGKHNLSSVGNIAPAMPGGVIPPELFKHNPNISTLYGTFQAPRWGTLIESIPEDLFSYTPNLTQITACFLGQKIKEIPSKLFHGLTKLTELTRTFEMCPLISIPEGLLKDCVNLTNMSKTFAGTFFDIYDTEPDVNTLTAIPGDIFDNKPKLENVSRCFENQTKVTSISETIFTGAPNITDITNVFAFMGITNISGNILAPLTKLITATGFVNNTKLAAIPEGLFANNPELKDVGGVFNSTKITTIPVDLLKNNPKIEECSQLFNFIETLTVVPEGIFDYNPEITKANRCFSHCYNLTTVPATLWDNNKKLTEVTQMYAFCTLIKSSVPELWNKELWPNITQYGGCYNGVTAAANVANIPNDWK